MSWILYYVRYFFNIKTYVTNNVHTLRIKYKYYAIFNEINVNMSSLICRFWIFMSLYKFLKMHLNILYIFNKPLYVFARTCPLPHPTLEISIFFGKIISISFSLVWESYCDTNNNSIIPTYGYCLLPSVNAHSIKSI